MQHTAVFCIVPAPPAAHLNSKKVVRVLLMALQLQDPALTLMPCSQLHLQRFHLQVAPVRLHIPLLRSIGCLGAVLIACQGPYECLCARKAGK